MDDIKYYGSFDVDGYPQGFFPSDIWPTPPDGVVEITQAQWQEFLANQGYRKWENGQVVPAEPKPIPTGKA